MSYVPTRSPGSSSPSRGRTFRGPLRTRRFAGYPVVVGILLAGLAVPAGAQEARPFTTEIALDVASPQIAAATGDASHVVVVARTRRGRVDVDHQRFGDPTYVAPNLVTAMVVDTRSATSVWLHEEPAQVGSFAFSPDGSRLAYLQYDGSDFGLRIHDVQEGSTRELPLASGKSIASSSSVTWTPDGAGVVIALRPEGWDGRASDAFYAMTDAPVIVQDSRNDFLAWDRVRNMADEEITALVDVEDGSVRELLDDVAPQDLGFSPDGARLTYSVANPVKTSYTRRDGTEYALYSLELAEGATPTELVAPSEKRLTGAWNEARDAYAYSDEGAVMVRRLGVQEEEDVTEGLRTLSGDTTEIDFSVEAWSQTGHDLLLTSENAWHVLNVDAGDLQTVFTLEPEKEQRPERDLEHWTDDGRYLYFSYSAPDRWDRGLMRLDIGSGVLDTLMLDDHVYGDWTFSDDGETVVFTMSDGDRPDDVWVQTSGYPTPTRLTELNPQLEDVALAETELVEYLDVDGNTLYGILYYPPGYEPGRRYPLVAEIYEEFFDNGFNENMNLVTAQGWLGFRPSVRFEEGYPGEAWLKAVPNAINELIQRGLVDEDRVGVYGQSYGGYAVNLLITQTDRFAAAANISGKVNIISFLGDSPKITTRNYAAAEVGQDRIGATLWEQPQKYIDHSAVMFADRIETPLLMLSGEGDWNVPATNQREMYYALRRLGKEVVWVHYTAGGHGAGRASTIGDFHDHWRRMFEWFAEHFDEAGDATISDEGGR